MNHPFTGQELKQAGIQLAAENADRVNDGWQEEAMECLKLFLLWNNKAFLCESFRKYAESECLLPPPPNARAYGAVILRAKKEMYIVHAGYAQVANPKAHMANASLWIKKPKENT